MVLTRDFKKTIAERINRDPRFAKALLNEIEILFLKNETETVEFILKDLDMQQLSLKI